MTRIVLIFSIMFLGGCRSTAPPQNNEGVSNRHLHIAGLTTTAHTQDGMAHLYLNAATATRDSQANSIAVDDVHATLAARHMHTISVATPHALWNEHTLHLTAHGPTSITHPHGTLTTQNSTIVALPKQRMLIKGPITHTLSYQDTTRQATAA